jgi:acetyl esterase/lipase
MQVSRRHLVRSSLALAASAALARPSPLFAASAAPALPMNLVHPELRPIVGQMQSFSANRPPLSRATLAEARKGGAEFFRKASADIAYERRMIPVGKPHPDVPVYIVNAKPGTRRPAILHTHGGGYIMGTAEQAIADLQDICRELDCVAVSVDYRLAPETTYKGSIEDNYAGLKWLHANAASLGADPDKIALLGESAGGGHAAILALTARDRGEVPVCFQCLIYPMIDDRTGSSRQVPPHVGSLIWTAQSNRFGWESFLGQKPGLAKAPLAAVPARVQNLKGLPPAFIAVGALDLFLDEDIDYAQRLNAAGVGTELVVVPGAFHGFDMIALMLNAPLGSWFRKTKMNALRRGFGLPALA